MTVMGDWRLCSPSPRCQQSLSPGPCRAPRIPCRSLLSASHAAGRPGTLKPVQAHGGRVASDLRIHLFTARVLPCGGAPRRLQQAGDSAPAGAVVARSVGSGGKQDSAKQTASPPAASMPSGEPAVGEAQQPLNVAAAEGEAGAGPIERAHADTLGGNGDVLWSSLQFLLLMALFFPPDFLLPTGVPAELPLTGFSTPLAAVVGAVSLAFAIQSFLDLGTSFSFLPKPAPKSTLKTGGAYGFVRHPMYSSQVLFFLCFALVSGSTTRVAVTLLLALALSKKAQAEEVHLVSRYGRDYIQYQSRVKQLIPFLY